MSARAERDAPLGVCLLDSIVPWGGGEAWCVATASALAARGHRAAIACARGSALERRARAAGLAVHAARLDGPAAVLAVPGLARFLRREGLELVIANVGRDVRTGAAACALAGARLLQRRGIARPLKRDPLSRWLYRGPVRRVVANCEAIRASLLAGADFADPRRFVVVRNAVETPDTPARADLRRELGLPPDALLVGTAGRLAPMKGLEHLLAAWPAVRAAAPAAHLVLAGAGELADDLAARARERGLAGSVHLLGFRADAPDVLADLDVFALPSVRDEGGSNALLEAMARGRPCVVARVGGLAETVADGEQAPCGLVVPPGDAAALGAALAALCGDGARRAELGERARALARERHAPDAIAARWEELLREVRERG